MMMRFQSPLVYKVNELIKSGCTSLTLMLKFIRPHYLYTLRPNGFMFGMMNLIGPKFCTVPFQTPCSSQGQVHRLGISMLKILRPHMTLFAVPICFGMVK